MIRGMKTLRDSHPRADLSRAIWMIGWLSLSEISESGFFDRGQRGLFKKAGPEEARAKGVSL